MTTVRATILMLAFGLAGAANAAPPAPCAYAEHQQFDFWVGDWRVLKPDGSVAGMNRITLEYGGCVIHEHYDRQGL
jgi:hypothetical protein